MFKIQSFGNAIKIKFAKCSKFAKSHFEHLTTDVFDRQTTIIKNTENYLEDVVFEKSGHLFPKTKATFQGKPIATTKKQLFHQLIDFHLDKYNWGDKEVAQRVKNNLLELGDVDFKTIASISKLFSEVNKEKLDEALIPNILLNKNSLSTLKNLFTHNRNLSPEEIKSIVNNSGFDSFKHINTLLEISPQKIENYKLGAFIKHSNTTQEEQLKSIINNANLNSSEMLDEVIQQNSLNPVKDNAVLVKDVMDRFSISVSDITRRINIAKEKLENTNDEHIKGFVYSNIFYPESEFCKNLKISKNYMIFKDGMKELEKNELLLDAYHCNNFDYSMINGEAQEYYKFLKEEANPELANKISTELESNIQELKDSHKRLLETTDAGMFNEAVRLEPVKQFTGIYGKEEPEMANYLYKNYFLTKMENCELKDMCIEINKKFGTKTFVDIQTTPYTLKKLQNELKNWVEASNGKGELPNIFDFSQAKKEFVKNGEIYTVAYSRRKDYSINMPAEHFYDKDTIRHEMMHLNDTEFVHKKGSINGIDFDSIKENKKYQEELKVAGIEGYQLEKYAYKDKGEFVAVASTGDHREYSKEFKDVLIKLGMPEWVFKLKLETPQKKLAKTLEDSFITLAKIGRNGDYDSIFPNGIMLVGKNSNLSDVAKWLAKESDCWLEKVDFSSLSKPEAMKRLFYISNKAKEKNKRTLIEINNFERYTTPTEENRSIIGALKSFLSDCGKDYKCTIIAHSDDMSKIDNIVVADHRFQIKIDEEGNQIW